MNPLAFFTDYLVTTIGSFGYFGIFFLMFLESASLPVPSEAILIPAGALIFQAKMSFFPVMIASLIGSILGALVDYYLALYLGRPAIEFFVGKYGKILFLSKESLAKTDKFFNKHGDVAIFIGRLIPVVRQLISLPAGFAEMNIYKFTIFTILGAAVWSALLIALGYFFGANIAFLTSNINFISLALVLLCLAAILFFYLRKKKKSKIN